jgi:hypothetical protein
MADPFGIDECMGVPLRTEPPNSLEFVAAEYWVRDSYRTYFKESERTPQTTTWQLERFFTGNESSDPVIDLVMEVLESDFKNTYSNAVVTRFKSLQKNGASEAALRALLREGSGGGDRKPDMLGIAGGREILLDCVEVGTVKTAQSTYNELNEKLQILKTAVIPQVKLRLPALRERFARSLQSPVLPNEFVVQASPFRLPPFKTILPLPIRVTAQGAQTMIDWICYRPSTNWKPSGAPASTSNRPGTDGIVLYHIHQTPLPEVPSSIRIALAKELNQWKQKQGYILELNPALIAAFGLNKPAWTRDERLLFTVLGVAGLLLVIVAVGLEVGVFAGAAAIADAGLPALAAAPAEFIAAMRASAILASQVWALAVSAVPMVPLARQ